VPIRLACRAARKVVHVVGSTAFAPDLTVETLEAPIGVACPSGARHKLQCLRGARGLRIAGQPLGLGGLGRVENHIGVG
jgi:hypothetical protein